MGAFLSFPFPNPGAVVPLRLRTPAFWFFCSIFIKHASGVGSINNKSRAETVYANRYQNVYVSEMAGTVCQRAATRLDFSQVNQLHLETVIHCVIK
jgi:hypothetical protein